MRLSNLGKVIDVTTFGSTYPAVSAPIFLRPFYKALSSTVAVNMPGSGQHCDPVQLEAHFNCTAQAGTNPTITLKAQGTNDIADNKTTITTTALAAGDTSIALTTRTGVPQYGYALLMSADGTKAEWVQVTSAAATGAGSHTIVRGAFGTTATTFAASDYFVWTTSWQDIPTANATTTTLTTAAVDISTAAASIPIKGIISSQQLGMSSIDFAIVRFVATIGGTSTPTASFTVGATLRARYERSS